MWVSMQTRIPSLTLIAHLTSASSRSLSGYSVTLEGGRSFVDLGEGRSVIEFLGKQSMVDAVSRSVQHQQRTHRVVEVVKTTLGILLFPTMPRNDVSQQGTIETSE